MSIILPPSEVRVRIPVAVLTECQQMNQKRLAAWSNHGPIPLRAGRRKGRSSARDRTPSGPSGTGGRLTILVNGVDLVDLAGCEDESGDQPAALSCRLYRRGDGRISPTLDPADVRAALEVALGRAPTRARRDRAWAQPRSSPAWSFATRGATLPGPAGPDRTVATARAGSTNTPFCTMPPFLRTMSPLHLPGLRREMAASPVVAGVSA